MLIFCAILQINLDLATPLPECSDLDSCDNEQNASTAPTQRTKAKIPVKVVATVACKYVIRLARIFYLQQITIGYEKPFSATLDNTTEAIGKNLARKRYKAFCKAVLKHPRLCKTMPLEIGNLVRTECANLSSQKIPSSFSHNRGKSDIGGFTWDAIALDLQTGVPIFYAVLVPAADRQWTRKAESPSPKCVPALGMAAAILLKSRNKQLSAVQTMISLVLNAGHVSSQV